jgi:hypothetical protein
MLVSERRQSWIASLFCSAMFTHRDIRKVREEAYMEAVVEVNTVEMGVLEAWVD